MPAADRHRPIVVLGGTGDGLNLARKLSGLGFTIIYSVLGLTTSPKESFAVRSGGFGGIDGLAKYLMEKNARLLIDATHPYAVTISTHALAATRKGNLVCWALRRPPWSSRPGDCWREFQNWAELTTLLSTYRRPLFTIGREPLNHLEQRHGQQIWLIRSLGSLYSTDGVIHINDRGPFTLPSELELLRSLRIDALISKNSGGKAVAAKLQAAAHLGIPVFMQRRPPLPAADREFDSLASLIMALDPA